MGERDWRALLDTLREFIAQGKFVVEARVGSQTYETLVIGVGVDIHGCLVAIVHSESSAREAERDG